MTRNHYYLEDNAGNVLDFDDVNLAVAGRIADLGSPEVEYLTSRATLQDGETVEEYQADSRPLTIPFYYRRATTERGWWANRQRLLGFLNPAAAPLTFGVWRSDGANYELRDVYPSPGVPFGEVESGSFEIRGEIEITAYDPIWWGVELQTATGTAGGEDNLVYPITYPIQYEASAPFVINESYDGSWRTYPTIILTGPYLRVTVSNSATGATFTLFREIEAGETRTIVTDPRQGISITDQDGNSAINELEAGATLTGFTLQPQTTVTIEADFVGDSEGNTALEIEYYNRFAGI